MCDNSFLCYTEFHVLGEKITGGGWFFLMIFGAFWLQIAANFVGLWRSQLTRETLKVGKESAGRHTFILKSVFWTFISTVLWILRVVLIIGNNAWVYGTILIGNVAGHLWALTATDADVTPKEASAVASVITDAKKVKLIL